MQKLATIKRSLTVLAIVVASYGAYALVAVPLIEPTIELEESLAATDEEKELGRNRPSKQHEELRAWFSERDWELTSRKMFAINRGILLFKEYTNGPDGTVTFKPCTVVMLADRKGKSLEEWRRAAIIMQAPEGADLKFDRALTFGAKETPQLESGIVRGKFTIRSDQKLPGPGDDLYIMSRDAQLIDHRIVSPHTIQFRMGTSYGSGRELRIDLIPAAPGQGEMGFNGVSRLEIKHDVIMHIDMADLDKKEDKPDAGPAIAPVAETKKPEGLAGAFGGGDGPQPPLRITSQGPFEFDLVHYVAKFRDRVDVLRLHPNGQSDSLKGELLSLFFAPAEGESTAPGRVPKLEPDRIEARGLPVVMESPMEELRAVGEHLIYQFGTQRVSLEGERPASVEHKGTRIEAPKLIYEPALKSAKSRFGRFSAIGPGHLNARPNAEKPDEAYRAKWSRQALFGPDQQHHIVSLLGQAEFEQAGAGKLLGEEIYVWCSEEPEGARLPLLPERMLAQGNVLLDSPRMACHVDKLQVWFITAELKGDPRIEELPAPSPLGGARSTGTIRLVAYRQPPGLPGGPATMIPATAQPVAPVYYQAPVPPPANEGPALGGLFGGGDGPPKSKYTVHGKLLQAELRLVPGDGERVELKPSQLRVRENVRVTEEYLDGRLGAPLVVTGDQVDFKQSSDLDGTLSVMGEPAHIASQGFLMEGPVVRMNRGTSELDVDGAGQLTLPADRDLEGNKLPNPRPLRVAWLKLLHFDGQVAHLEDNVQAELDGQTLRSQSMDVTFAERVNFAQPVKKQPEVAELACAGRVTVEGSTLDPLTGQLASIYQMESGPVRVNRPTGDVHAQGPGHMVTVRKGALAMPDPTTGDPAQSSLTTPPSDELTYVRVDFLTRADGNLNTRTMTFSHSTKTIFGPVKTWDDTVKLEDLDRLGPDRRPLVERCGYLDSQQLTVAQIELPNGMRSLLLDAAGNASFEGFNFANETFVAKGNHIKYEQAKELVILEGDGRVDAELVRWRASGTPGERATSRKIDFWLPNGPRPPRVYVDGARHIDLAIPQRTQTPAPGGARLTPLPPTQPPGGAPGSNPFAGTPPYGMEQPAPPSAPGYPAADARFGPPSGSLYSDRPR